MEERGAELAMAPHRAQAVGAGDTGLGAAIDEFLLQSPQQAQPGLLLERRQRALQKGTGTAIPGRAVGVDDIAEVEVFRRRTVAEFHPHLGGRVRHQQQVAERPKGTVADRAEGGDGNVGGRPADTLGQPRLKVLCREPLAPDLGRDVAVAEHDQLVAKHEALPQDPADVACRCRISVAYRPHSKQCGQQKFHNATTKAVRSGCTKMTDAVDGTVVASSAFLTHGKESLADSPLSPGPMLPRLPCWLDRCCNAPGDRYGRHRHFGCRFIRADWRYRYSCCRIADDHRPSCGCDSHRPARRSRRA